MCKITMKAVQAVDYNGKLYHDQAAAAQAALAELAEQFVSKDRATLVKLLVANAAELTFLLEILEENDAPSALAEGPKLGRSADPAWKVMRDLAVERMNKARQTRTLDIPRLRQALSNGGLANTSDFADWTSPDGIERFVNQMGWTLASLLAWEEGREA